LIDGERPVTAPVPEWRRHRHLFITPPRRHAEGMTASHHLALHVDSRTSSIGWAPHDTPAATILIQLLPDRRSLR
jgi:hypothetical protein